MKTFSLTFDGSGTDTQTLPGGHYVIIYSGSSAITLQALENGTEISNLSGVTQGIALRTKNKDGTLREFNAVKVTSALAQTVVMAVGYGEVENFAATGNVTATVTKSTSGAVDKKTISNASAAIVAADTTRRRARIRNNSTTEILYVSPAAATTNDYPVGPGEEYVHETTSALNGIRGGATDIDVRVVTEKD